MKQHAARDRLYSLWAEVGKALSSPRRLELLELIAQGERTVEELAREAGLTINNASAHLSVLTKAGLVERRKASQSVYHRVTGPETIVLLRSLQSMARKASHEVQNLAERHFDGRDKLEPVTAAELSQRLRKGRVTLIDVRPDHEYRAGHIEGAISVPLNRLQARLPELPRSRPVIAYCRGPYCLFAIDAVEQLRDKGFKSFRLAIGYPDWAAEGRPVVATAKEAQGSHTRKSSASARSRRTAA